MAYEIEQQLGVISTTYLQGLSDQVVALDQTLEGFMVELATIPEKEIQFVRLSRQTEILSELFTLLQTRLQEVRIAEAVEIASVRVVDPAILPGTPVRPRKRLNLLIGLVFGVSLGAGAALLREYMDDAVHTREDLVAATGGMTVMGVIPRIRSDGSHRNGPFSKQHATLRFSDRLVVGQDPGSSASEAYRGLRTNITFARADQAPKSLVVTSPFPKDGKSTTAANLAITLAQLGVRAILVDADLRRGHLHVVFQESRTPGLSEFLLDDGTSELHINTLDLGHHHGTLDFVSTGASPPNPAELLGSMRMKKLIMRLQADYEAVILDSPPLMAVTDAAILGAHVDGTLLVARASVTAKGALSQCVEQLRHVRAPILGLVLNDVDRKREGRYGHQYGIYEGYSDDGQISGNGDRRASRQSTWSLRGRSSG